jgi:ankyrin repeat protein
MACSSPSSPRQFGSAGVRFLKAISKGDIETVLSLFHRRGKPLLHVFGLDGVTPLLLACKKGYLAIAQFLVANGARIADRDKDAKRQGNAIHYACWGGNLEVVQWLLGTGAQLDEMDIVGNTPMLYAIYGGHMNVVEHLISMGRTLREKNLKHHTAILQVCSSHSC